MIKGRQSLNCIGLPPLPRVNYSKTFTGWTDTDLSDTDTGSFLEIRPGTPLVPAEPRARTERIE